MRPFTPCSSRIDGAIVARALYTLLYYLALPLILLRIWWRGRRAPAYRQRISERLGCAPTLATEGRPIWVHAVSVGETVAIAPLIERLLARYPQHPILVTTMTPTGAERVQALFGTRVQHRYCPWDLPDAWWRFHRRVNPALCIIVETELWPNMLAACAARNVPVVLANARLSARSARGYARIAPLVRPMLGRLTLVAAQSRADGERFIELGLAREQLHVTGSIKFDLCPDPNQIEAGRQLRVQLGETRPVLIAASTHEGEDELLLRCWQQLALKWPGLVLMLVPRHPERFAAVRTLAQGYSDAVCSRREADPVSTDTEIYIGDTMGELMLMYAAADVAFVGGSFSGTGGHNPLEPAALGKPVVVGPDTFNFAEITRALSDAGGLRQVQDESGLVRILAELIGSASARQRAGEAGRRYLLASQGALERLERLVAQQLLSAVSD
jgi:3-deoxy-D-manno-octulosonic-acid transferase